ncbi:MAG: glycosyltransferase family 9 protein [Oscillochloris sp.]|nr:glycosyltransferase family 9 protein [Oscillochloris sp.]
MIAELNLLITNDTGASHLAAALGVPSVVIFGPTRPHVFAPLNRALHRVVDALDYTPSRYGPVAALRALPVEPVLQAALAQLDIQRRRKPVEPLAERAVGG